MQGCSRGGANLLRVPRFVVPRAAAPVGLLLLLTMPFPGASPARRGAWAAAAPPPAVVAARDASSDATAANNQVKLVRAPDGLVLAYVGLVEGVPQIALAASRDGGASWAGLGTASAGPIPSRLPALAVDRGGRVHVVWTRYDDGVGKVYYRVWARGAWSAAQVRISPPAGYAGYPAVALDNAERPQVVWYGIREGQVYAPTRHGSIYEILAAGFDGHAWAAPRLISSGPPDAINPALASGRAGTLHAVWYQYDGRVYQLRYARRDGGWAAPEGVLRTGTDQFNPDVAADPDGRIAVAWEEHDTTGGSVIDYARRAGTAWDGPVALSAGGAPAHHPSVALGPRGTVEVTWDQDDGQVYLRRFDGRWGPVVRLTADGGNTFPSVLAEGLAVDVAWTHAGPGGAATVVLTRLAR